jgi:hypothetical protein
MKGALPCFVRWACRDGYNKKFFPTLAAVLRIRMFIQDPGSDFFYTGSRIQG